MSCGSCAVAVCISVSDTALGTTLSTSCRTVASLYVIERLFFGDSGIACLDKYSAPLILPGMYFTVKSNCYRYISHLSIRIGGLLLALFISDSRGLWSDRTVNVLPMRYV